MSDAYSTKTLSCHLLSREYAEFDRLARLKGITPNELLSQTVRQYIEDEKQRRILEERLARKH